MRHLMTLLAVGTLASCGPQDADRINEANAPGGGKADQVGETLDYVCGGFTDICPDQMFCPDGQGERSCVMCPLASCAAPPQGCDYSGEPWIDSNGCAYGCGGSLLCKDKDGDYTCGGPFTDKCPDGMFCPAGMGERKCTLCPLASCAAPPQGCEYSGEPWIDSNGCAYGCGSSLLCKDKDGDYACGGPFTDTCPKGMICPDGIGERKCMMCPIFSCAAPPEGCDYAGPAPLDENGCAIGCGQLLCRRTSAEL